MFRFTPLRCALACGSKEKILLLLLPASELGGLSSAVPRGGTGSWHLFLVNPSTGYINCENRLSHSIKNRSIPLCIELPTANPLHSLFKIFPWRDEAHHQI